MTFPKLLLKFPPYEPFKKCSTFKDFGSEIEVPTHVGNASSSIISTLFGITICLGKTQPIKLLERRIFKLFGISFILILMQSNLGKKAAEPIYSIVFGSLMLKILSAEMSFSISSPNL